ncbi:MAG: DJ-1/PfpI family protein [Azospirillaceae bacterium]
MSDKTLAGKTVAILVANGFEETDMTEPQRALLAAGAQLRTISPEQALVNGWHEAAWGHYFPVDGALSEALAADYDALLVPGGTRGVEKLAGNPHTKRFLKGFVDGNKPVALIGEATGLLVAAERAENRTLAMDDGVREDLVKAGAKPAETPVHVDRALMTANREADLPAIKDALVKLFTEGAEDMADAA